MYILENLLPCLSLLANFKMFGLTVFCISAKDHYF